MKKTSLLLLTALLSGLFIPLQAQKLEYTHTVELVGLLPTGSFSKSVDMNPGYPILERNQIGKDAALGVGLDYRFGVKFDIAIAELKPFAEIGFFWNRISRDHRDAFDDQRSKDPRYKNIPLMIGLQYRHDLTPIIKPYAEFAFGVDWFFPGREGDSDHKTDAADPTQRNPYYVFKPSAASAWQLGAGVYIAGKVSAGLTYYNLGKHAIDYNIGKTYMATVGTSASNATTEWRRVHALALKIGFHF